MQVHIRKARVIDPHSPFHNQVADLLVEDGIITNIAATIDSQAATVLAADGLCVSPGWIDAFADYREPGLEHKETIASGLAAAAAGGFAHVLLSPNTQPALSSRPAIQYALQLGAGHTASLHPMGTATQNADGKDLAEMLDMHTYGAIAFTDGWKPIQSAGLMLKALEYVKAFNGLVMQIPVDAAMAAGGLMNEGIISTGMGMPGIPALAETLALHRDIELLRYTGSRLHATGITTAASVAMVRQAKADGLALTCSVTPYHLALTDGALTGYDSIYKVMPPLRGDEDRIALIAGLQDGTIDCIATHHRPHEWDAKAKEFEYAADGMAVQETAFNILWDTLKSYLTIDRLVAALTPYTVFGIAQPKIDIGGTAAITIFTPGGSHTLNNDKVQSASRNNPFIGKPLAGRVLGVINNRHIHLNT